jgi:hypothetical protein
LLSAAPWPRSKSNLRNLGSESLAPRAHECVWRYTRGDCRCYQRLGWPSAAPKRKKTAQIVFLSFPGRVHSEVPWGRGAGHHCEQKAFQFIGNKDRVIAFLRILVLVLPREARSAKMRRKSPADPIAPASSQRPAEDPPKPPDYSRRSASPRQRHFLGNAFVPIVFPFLDTDWL